MDKVLFTIYKIFKLNIKYEDKQNNTYPHTSIGFLKEKNKKQAVVAKKRETIYPLTDELIKRYKVLTMDHSIKESWKHAKWKPVMKAYN